MREASVVLPDGRTLAYTDLGASSGSVVMYFHGAPSSRLDLAYFEDDLAARGVRVISPERPGFGRSSPQPGRRREDWPMDVVALADHVGVQRFAVLGLSSGGHYAVTCAALLPDRVTAAAIVEGETDFAWTGAWDGYAEYEATLMRTGDENRGTAWCEAHYGSDGAGFFEIVQDIAPADQAAFQDEAFTAALTASVREAFRQGVGAYAQDVVIQGRPWTFAPHAIVAPVLIHHGEADTMTPVAHSRHTSELIPGARLTIWPHEGHISLITKIPGIAAELVAVPS
jgi:pimeloyl-ACP methyl ester carboxylesterase